MVGHFPLLSTNSITLNYIRSLPFDSIHFKWYLGSNPFRLRMCGCSIRTSENNLQIGGTIKIFRVGKDINS